jgi:hypothetical protein
MSENKINLVCPRLELNLNLPDHTSELAKAESIISDIANEVKKTIKRPVNKNAASYENSLLESKLNDKTYIKLYEEIAKMLDYVWQLSTAIFDVEFEIENAYVLKYIHNPKEAKLAWYMHYSELHNPYTLLKNRCFNLFGELDTEYETKFGKLPPNYNY